MIATVPYIEGKYRQFNSLMFEGTLPEIPIMLSHSRCYPGQVCFTRRRHLLRDDTISDLRLKISTVFDFGEEELEDVIIHEMIHCSILSKGLHDSSAHGRIFRKMMTEINTKFGRHVTISHKISKEQKEEMQARQTRKTRTVALVTLKDGRRGIKVIPRTQRSIARYISGIKRHFSVDNIQLYTSDDPFFAGFPCSSALRIYLLKEEELSRHFTNNIRQ